jgi:hypothetical protein
MKKGHYGNIHFILFMLLILGISSGGCSGDASTEKTESFRAIFLVKNVNESLKLSKVDVEGYRDRNSFVIMLENRTDSFIVFPKDFGIRLYRYTNGKWLEIPNKGVYLTDENMVLKPRGYPLGLNQSEVPFYPDLPDLQQPVSIRLAVKGNIQNEDGSLGEEVGAYIDFTWEP